MRFAKLIAQCVDKITTWLSIILVIVFLLFGGYSLWNMRMLMTDAFKTDRLVQYKPSEDTPEDEIIAEMNKDNPDGVAWITVDDTNIDYPIVQGPTNLAYLNKDFYGNFSLAGTPFLDFRNTKDFSDNYNVIYGHNVNGTGMFGSLELFLKKDHFDTHKTGTLYTREKIYNVIFFAVVETYSTDDVVFGANNLTDSDMNTLLKYISDNSTHYRDIGIEPGCKILALTTCSSTSTDGRVALYGLCIEKETRHNDIANKPIQNS